MDTYSKEGEQLLFMAPSQPKPLLGCVDNEMRDCTGNNLECAGQENSNYVFSLDDGKITMYNQVSFGCLTLENCKEKSSQHWKERLKSKCRLYCTIL